MHLELSRTVSTQSVSSTQEGKASTQLLQLKLEGRAGDGGNAGVEYEGGKAEGLKRGVKANMFRII